MGANKQGQPLPEQVSGLWTALILHWVDPAARGAPISSSFVRCKWGYCLCGSLFAAREVADSVGDSQRRHD
jgi:hypothetical protein